MAALRAGRGTVGGVYRRRLRAVRPRRQLGAAAPAAGNHFGSAALEVTLTVATAGVASHLGSTVDLPITVTVGTAGTTFGFPATITDTGVSVETNSDIGPIKDANGNLYTVTEVGGGNLNPAMHKSTDGGETWAEVDSAGRPAMADLESVWLVADLSNHLIHMVRQRTSGTTTYVQFRVSTHGSTPDTWGSTQAVSSTAGNVDTEAAAALVRRSDGSLVLFYRTDPSGSDRRIGYRIRSTGGTWGSESILDSAAGKDFTQVTAVVGESDKVHVAYVNLTDGTVLHRSLDSGGSLSSSEVVNDNAISTLEHPMANIVYMDDGGTERVYVAWLRNSDSLLVGAEITDDGTPGAEEAITDVAVRSNPTNIGSNMPAAFLTADGTTLYAVYVDNSSNDIWYSRKSGGAWGTDVEIQDATSAQSVSARVFTHSAGNGSQKVLGVVYDFDTGVESGGEPRYTEIGAATSYTGSASLPVTVTVGTAGSKTTTSTVAFPVTVTVATNGVRTRLGAATVPVSFNAAVNGTRTTFSTVTLPITVTVATDGRVAGDGGVASLQVTFAAATVGRVTAKGRAALPVTLTVASLGRPTFKGTASTPVAFNVSLVGRVSSYSTVTMPIVWTVGVDGRVPNPEPTLDAILTGWIANAVTGYAGVGVTGGIAPEEIE